MSALLRTVLHDKCLFVGGLSWEFGWVMNVQMLVGWVHRKMGLVRLGYEKWTHDYV